MTHTSFYGGLSFRRNSSAVDQLNKKRQSVLVDYSKYKISRSGADNYIYLDNNIFDAKDKQLLGLVKLFYANKHCLSCFYLVIMLFYHIVTISPHSLCLSGY